MTKGLCILGSTGSIGQNCLRVVQSLPGRFRIVSLSAGKNLEVLAEQILEFSPQVVSVGECQLIEPLRERLRLRGHRAPLKVVAEISGQVEAVTLPEVDFVVSASHGTTGLVATYEAVRAGKQLGLANKETLVVAGELVMQAARERALEGLPVDNGNCARHQRLPSRRRPEGGPPVLDGPGGPVF